MILIDSSSSVKLDTFHHQIKPFLLKLYKKVTQVIRYPRTSLATFNGIFNHFQRFTFDKNRVMNAIRSMTYTGGGTALAPAMSESAKYVKYYGRKGVETIFIIITDGHLTMGMRVREVLRKVKSAFNIIIPIGITNSINQYRLRKIAKHSRMTRLTHIKLKKAASIVIDEICRPVFKSKHLCLLNTQENKFLKILM